LSLRGTGSLRTRRRRKDEEEDLEAAEPKLHAGSD